MCYLNVLEMAKEFVEKAVNDNPVVVFSKTYCPFCKMAKDALRQAGLKETDYVRYELDERGKLVYLLVSFLDL